MPALDFAVSEPDLPDKPTFTIEEVARILGVGRGTAYRSVQLGQIPSLACPDTSIAALLLDWGADVDVRSVDGATPLMNAVQNGDPDKITFLIEHGADVEARDLRGFTAMHRGAEGGRTDVARLLLERGAALDPEAQGQTPLSLAEAHGRTGMAAFLREQGAGAS
jgi:ankyrin repeat protein